MNQASTRRRLEWLASSLRSAILGLWPQILLGLDSYFWEFAIGDSYFWELCISGDF